MIKRYDSCISGYYGMSNSGDDALMYATAWGAINRLHSRRVTICAWQGANSVSLQQVNSDYPARFRGQQRLRHSLAALSSKQVIFGGGSVFHSKKDIDMKRHMMLLAGRKSSMAVGVSLGPFKDVADEQACRRFLNQCGFVGVRDQQSLELANCLAPQVNVRLTFDLAPSLLSNPDFTLKLIPREGVAFNFCQVATSAFGETDATAEQQRVNNACELISHVWRDTGQPIYLVDLNGHSRFGDQHIHQQIIKRLPADMVVTHIPYDNNPYRLLQRLAGYRAVICMRLHAAILSYMAETPVLFIQYHDKCEQWSDQIGLPSSYRFNANDFCPDSLATTLKQGLNNHFILPNLPLEQAIEKSLSNWSFANEHHPIFSGNSAVQQA